MSTTANPNTPAIFNKPGELQTFLQTGKGAIAAALPKHLNPDRMLRLALTAFSTTPALRQCTGQSILASIVVASQLGLEPGVAGQGYLIPYKNTCTFVPGWQGLVGLLNNTGRATAWTGAVFKGDVFDYSLGSHPKIDHKPGPNFGDVDELEWVYACGKVNGSEQPVIEAWPMSRVIKHRNNNNKVGSAHYSFRHLEMYARKVVLLQVLKYMPRSIELNNAIVAADAAEMARTTFVSDGVIEMNPEDVEVKQGEPDMTPRKPRAARPPAAAAAPTEGPGPETLFTGEDPAPVKRDAVKPSMALRNLIKASRRSESAVLAWMVEQGYPQKSTLDFHDDGVIKQIIEGWADFYQDIPEASDPA